MLLPHYPAGAQEANIVSRTLKGQRLNELGLWNLGGDKVYEIFTTSVSGKASCFSADTLEPLWEQQITGEALTAPAIGTFMADGSPILAFGSLSGKVYFLWPGSGEIISTIDTGLSLSVPPSVAAMADGDKLVLVGDDGQIAVVDLDATTGLPNLRWLIPNTLSGATAFSVVGQISQPAACSDLNNDGIPEVVVTSDSGVLQVISLSEPPQRYSTRLPQQARATTPAALGDLTGTGQNAIILGVIASIQLFNWDPALPPEKAIVVWMSTPAYGESLGHLLLGPINADPVNDLLSTANTTIAVRYLGNDFSGKQAFLDIAPQHLTTSESPFSPAIAVTRADGSSSVVSIDNSGTAWDWEPTSAQNTMTRINDVPVPTGFAPGGDLTGSGKLSLVIWNQETVSLSVATLPIDLAPGSATEASSQSGPVLTLGVNYSRNGQWGTAWATDWNAKRQAAAAALARLKADGGAGNMDDSESTTDSVSMIAGLDPHDPVAVTFRESRNTGIPIAALAGGALVLLAVIFLGVWKMRKPR